MYSKDIFLKLIYKYFKSKKVRNKFVEQINYFYNVKSCDLNFKNYKIGEEVIINKYHLIHGTRMGVNELIQIKDNGLIAVEFYDKEYPNQKKPYTCEFWKFNQDIKLRDYLLKYTGGTLIFKRKEGNKEIITSIDNLANEICNMKESYANWEIYQTKEARFLPTNPNITCAFILNTENENANKMVNNSIQGNLLNERIKKKILPKWFYNKYVKNGFHNYDVFETDREVAILFGLPSSLIEGIIVNREIEKNIDELNKIKEIFSKCYISNVNGVVIK